MNKIPYIDYKKLETTEELNEYIKFVSESVEKGEYPIYGEPAFRGEAPVTVFDKKGNKLKTEYEYFITECGIVKRYNSDGSVRDVNKTEKHYVKRGIQTKEPAIKNNYCAIQLQLWSFYPHLDWSHCRIAKNDATIDHILQHNELGVHFGLLEVVPRKVNIHRSKISDQGKVHSKNQITSLCKRTNDKIDGEIWRYENEWTQKDEILKIFEHKRDVPPKAISNKGRLKVGRKSDMKIIRGQNLIGHPKLRRHSGHNVAKLVHLAFLPEKIGNLRINHLDGENKHPEVYLNDGSGRYSNALGTFYLGTNKENMEDMSKCRQREYEMDPMNEFECWDGDKLVGTYHYKPHAMDELQKLYLNKNIARSSIGKCLNGEMTHHQKLKFKYVIAR